MKKQSWFLTNLLFLLFFFFLSCTDEKINEPLPTFTYQIPEQTNDGWETANIEDVDINIEKLSELIDFININLYKNIHCVMIVKDGKLVFEEYFRGHTFQYDGNNHEGPLRDFNINTIHNQASVTKSFTSALVGIAIDEGFISSTDEKVFSFFPEYENQFTGNKKDMTIEHLLTMSAGFDWNEWDVSLSSTQNDLLQMWQVSDPLLYLVSKPLATTPGTQFYYNSGCTNLLGEIVFRATGLKPDIFADKYLFNKLGFSDRTWEKFSNGVVFVSGDLRIRPRDMAKFGYLYLNNGNWKGEQIISQQWVKKSIEEFISINDTWKYGYKWWITNYDIEGNDYWSFGARGWGGQRIIVFPSLNMVLVFTGGNYIDYEPVDEIIQGYILPAVL